MISQYLHHYAGLPKQNWLIIFIQLINSIFISICYFLPLYFVTQLHFDVSTAGFIISFYGLGTMVGGILGGIAADKLHPYWVVIISLVLQAFSFLLLSSLSSFVFLAFNLFVLGVSTYSFITANFLWALLCCQENEEQKIKSINILDTVANLGLGISAIILSMLLMQDLKTLSMTAGLCLLSLTSFLLFQYHPELKATVSAKTDSQQITNSMDNRIALIGLVITCLFLVGLIISQLGSTYSIYLNTLFPSYHFGSFGLLFALNTFLVVTLQTPLANYCRHYNRILLAGSGAFLLGLGMFMLTLSFSIFMIALACVIYTLGEILFFSVAQLICYENAPVSKKGLMLGIYRVVYACSRIVGPATGAYIYQQFGSDTLWYACGIIGCTCLTATIYFEYLRSRVQMAHH